MGFSRQELWSGLSCPPPGDLPYPTMNLHLFHLLHWQVDSLPLAPRGKLSTMGRTPKIYPKTKGPHKSKEQIYEY